MTAPKWKRSVDEGLREEVLDAVLAQGLRVRFLPKKGFRKKACVLSVRFGSLDGAFHPPGSEETVQAPAGLAHFLEHRVFTSKEGDAFERFAALGADSNAFTSYGHTAYYFTCVDNFFPSLRILLGFLNPLHVTVEMVDHERGIIAEEVRGSRDNPGEVGYARLMSCLYRVSHARFDIVGTQASIDAIDRDLLLAASGAFYHPANTDLYVSGDIDPASLLEAVGEGLAGAPDGPAGKPARPAEPPGVAARASRVAMAVSLPKVLVGFKDPEPAEKGPELVQRQLDTNIGLSALFGRASDFFRDAYEEGILNDSFHAQHHSEPDLGYTLFGMDTERPDAFLERLFDHIEGARKEGIEAEDLQRLLRRIRGRYIRNFNHPETAAFALLHHDLRGLDVLALPGLLDRITLEGVNRCVAEHLDPARHARSLVLPRGKAGPLSDTVAS